MNNRLKRERATHREGLGIPCERCRLMTSTQEGLQALASKGGYKHHDIGALRRFASQCSFCSLLCVCLDQFTSNFKDTRHLRLYSEARGIDVQTDLAADPFAISNLSVKVCTGSSFMASTFKLHAYTSKGNRAAMFLEETSVAMDVTSDAITQKIKVLLDDCGDRHGNCTSRSSPELPSRVIDVGPGDGANLPRLYISKVKEKSPYIALSYCWGGTQEITTTLASLQTRTEALPMPLLPQTIQDAINVTRRLGFQYLWVDALCIIQDSAADKIVEINAMGTTYMNATLTIAAANSVSVKEGFLMARTPPLATRLPFYLPGGASGDIWLLSYDQLRRPTEPLDSRAWAFQESLLSPRILYYGAKEIIWNCRSGGVREIIRFSETYSLPSITNLPALVFGNRKMSNSRMLSHQRQTWKSIMENFSGRNITLAEDRLPALAGIAGELQKVWDDTYIAGLWRRCLVNQLAWYNGTRERNPTPIGAYQSPGWSWVSYNHGILVFNITREDAEVLDYTVTLEAEDAPLSRVVAGRLSLRGMLAGALEIRQSSIYSYSFWMDNVYEGESRIREGTQLFFLGYQGRNGGYGLILEPSSTGLYMRIGAISVYDSATLDIIWPKESKRQVVTII